MSRKTVAGIQSALFCKLGLTVAMSSYPSVWKGRYRKRLTSPWARCVLPMSWLYTSHFWGLSKQYFFHKGTHHIIFEQVLLWLCHAGDHILWSTLWIQGNFRMSLIPHSQLPALTPQKLEEVAGDVLLFHLPGYQVAQGHKGSEKDYTWTSIPWALGNKKRILISGNPILVCRSSAAMYLMASVMLILKVTDIWPNFMRLVFITTVWLNLWRVL